MGRAELENWRETAESGNQLQRRDFIKAVTMAAAAVGLSSAAAMKVVEAASKGLKPSVIWLHFQECTGCTESLLRTSHPALTTLILDHVSLDDLPLVAELVLSLVPQTISHLKNPSRIRWHPPIDRKTYYRVKCLQQV